MIYTAYYIKDSVKYQQLIPTVNKETVYGFFGLSQNVELVAVLDPNEDHSQYQNFQLID